MPQSPANEAIDTLVPDDAVLHSTRELYRSEYRPIEKDLESIDKVRHFVHAADKFLGRLARDYQSDPALRELIEEYRGTAASSLAETDTGKTDRLTRQISSHLHSNYSYFFNIIDGYKSGKELPEELESIERTLVGTVVTVSTSKRGLLSNGGARDKSLHELTSAVMRAADDFVPNRKLVQRVQELTPDKLEEGIDEIEAVLVAEQSVLLMDPAMRANAFREWLRQTYSDERQGIKVYGTPYYERIIKRCELLGDKENGIGGRIYYGPPGTGKTELGIEINRREGFQTRVVSIHYWSDFVSLIGESTVPVGVDKATGYQQRMMSAKQEYNDMDVDKFWEVVEGLHRKKAQHGTDEHRGTLLGTILPFTVGLNVRKYTGLPLEDLSVPDRTKIKEAFERYLEVQVLGASLGLETGEDPMLQWVNGELLIAIENGQRVLLDEIDKAGPNSFGGISYLLAKTPGGKDGYIEVKGRRVALPSWFRVDATSNEVILDKDVKKQFLYNRFNHVQVGYPSPADELMIAAVRLSDGEGNLMLSDPEQQQMVNFLFNILPKVRRLYEDGYMLQPFSLRNSKEICDILVNPLTKKRTNISVQRAVEMVLLEQRNYGKVERLEGAKRVTHDAKELLNKILQENAGLIRNLPVNLEKNKRQSGFHQERTRQQLVTETLQLTANSPFARYAMYEPVRGKSSSVFNPDLDPQVRFERVVLRPELLKFQDKEWQKSDDESKLYSEGISEGNTTSEMGVNVYKEDNIVTVDMSTEGQRMVKYQYQLEKGETLLGASALGDLILTRFTKKIKNNEYTFIKAYRGVDSGKFTSVLVDKIGDETEEDSQFFLSAGGNYVIKSNKGEVTVYNLTSDEPVSSVLKGNVVRWTLSADERLLLYEVRNGTVPETRVVNLKLGFKRGDVTNDYVYFTGSNYRFAGSSFISQPNGSTGYAVLES